MFKIKSAKFGLMAVLLVLTAITQGWPQFVSAEANEGAIGGPNTMAQAAISTGGLHTCALLSTGAVKCWGSNSLGELGDTTTDNKSTPTQVDGLTSGVTAISTGESYTCALLSTGAVKCWGLNNYGQLGDTTTVDKSTPTQVDGLTSGVTAISAGGNHTCALLSTGAVKCWGSNAFGQLGDTTTVDKSTPTQVDGLTSGVTAISAGGDHTCALLSTGAMQCWGSNAFGQLGDTTSDNKSTPTQVDGLTSGVTAISAGGYAGGGYQTCALLSTGAVKCWGFNFNGQLGDTTDVNKFTPTQVDGLTSGVTAITAGQSHTCALLSTGAVKCWGWNFYGQLGDTTTGDKMTPTQVDGLTSGVTAITAGGYQTCALLSTGAMQCWGSNSYGQLGDATNVDKSTPSQVDGLTSGVGPTTTTTTTEPETTTTTTASTTTTAASTTIAVVTTVVSASELPETGSQSDGWIIAAIIAMISGTVLVTRRRNFS